jgi:hypothetical protein
VREFSAYKIQILVVVDFYTGDADLCFYDKLLEKLGLGVFKGS